MFVFVSRSMARCSAAHLAGATPGLLNSAISNQNSGSFSKTLAACFHAYNASQLREASSTEHLKTPSEIRSFFVSDTHGHQDAIKAPREELLYVPCLPLDDTKPDYLSTVDVNPDSATYGTVIHRLPMPHAGDELHHTGWNACSSCVKDASKKRDKLILPGFASSRIYIVDTSDAKAPKLHHTVEPDELKALGVSAPHTSHCLASGEVMLSTLGDAEGDHKGSFVLLDGDTFAVKGTWSDTTVPYGYDFWYQPRHNVMLSSEFGTPSSFFQFFDPSLVPTHYGSKVHVWDWTTRELKQSLDLGPVLPLEIRFHHRPDSTHAFVGAALGSKIIHIHKDGDEWKHEVVINQPWSDVEGWALPQLPPLTTDIILSMDDRFLYFSNWLRGDICQYDVSDPSHPKLTGRVWLGGVIKQGSPVRASSEVPTPNGAAPPKCVVKGVEIRGGPQMIQLSLDGKRLYVTTSLLKPWDRQFYPDLASKGAQMLQLDIDTEAGGMRLNEAFLVDFGDEPDGPALAHEMRYPGGDCTSDIWL